jgi:translation elongation factor EF-4
MKQLEKQKQGKQRLKKYGNVQVPVESFRKVMGEMS